MSAETLLTTIGIQMPNLAVCIAAIIFLLARGDQIAGRNWALAAFALGLILCVGAPIGHHLIAASVYRTAGPAISPLWMFTAFSVFTSMIHALVYALLVAAIFAGRARPGSNP